MGGRAMSLVRLLLSGMVPSTLAHHCHSGPVLAIAGSMGWISLYPGFPLYNCSTFFDNFLKKECFGSQNFETLYV
jgi:hypothetical protein